MKRSKKGISLVALVITIVVMMILSGAVIITGISVPQDAQLAVFKSNIATVQDAVTMKMLNNQIDNVTSANKENLKWVGVVKDYDGSKEIDFSKGEVVGGVLALPLSEELVNSLNIKASELANYYITEEGIVYHKGITINGETHYNNNVVARDYTMKQVIDEGINLTQGSQVSISTAEELKSLATYTNAGNNTKGVTFKLTKDITLNKNVLNEDGTLNETNASSFEEWIPIGTPRHAWDEETQTQIDIEPTKFEGVFDGQNHSVKGLYINVGAVWSQALFGSSNGIISNVKVEDSYIYSEGGHIAGIVGTGAGIIENCISSAIIYKGDKGRFAGGIVGYFDVGAIRECANTGNITSTNNTGGIVGGVHPNVNIQLTDCYNTGAIIGKMSGGIVAECNSTTVVNNCYNTGNIEGSSYSGGIVGCTYSDVKIICCYNTGNIEGSTNVAGIAGRNNGVILSSYNEGIVNGGTCGGVTGWNHGTVINSYNKAKIEGSNTNNGGIAGYTDGYITNCYNKGDIYCTNTGTNVVAGISGRIGYVNYVYNLGNVYGNGTHVGGISSSFNSSISSLTNAFNLGTASTTKEGERIRKHENQVDTTVENLSVVVGGSTYTTLVSALNAWVDANKTTYPELKNWELENGYPVFVD